MRRVISWLLNLMGWTLDGRELTKIAGASVLGSGVMSAVLEFIRSLPIPILISIIIGIAILLFIGFGYLWDWINKHKEAIKVEEKHTHIDESVTSINQQGGITARNVIVQPSDRKLSSNHKQQIKDIVSKRDFKKIRVIASMGDAEIYRLALQIKDYLVSEGYDIPAVDQAVFVTPIRGIQIDDTDDNGLLQVIAGSR
ncbi:hypothetical protein ACFLV4_05775 [Chloroflexota bacterium]